MRAAVVAALARVLERPPASLTGTTPLAEVGADSLALVEVAELVESDLDDQAPGLHLADADLEALVTVDDVVDAVSRAVRRAVAA